MAEKILDTRIQLKRDTYANWMSSSLVLKEGEFAVATIPAETGAMQQEPAVVVKVGDGQKTFKDLPFLTAKAGDIYAWARAEKKPTYEAKEITGIADYIAEYVEDTMGISVDTNNLYRIVKVDDYNYKLQTKGKDDADTAWADVAESAIVIPNDTEAIAAAKKAGDDAAAALEAYKTANDKALADEIARATQAEGDINVKIGEVAADKTVVQMIADAQTAATYDDTQVKADIKANTDAIGVEKGRIDTLVGTDTGKSARAIAAEELAKQLIPETADEALNTLEEIAAWIQDHPDDASAMNEAITALQKQLQGIDAGEGTVKKYVDDAISALSIGDYAKAADLLAAVGRIEAMEAKVANWDAAEQNAKDHADSLNTAMNTRVEALEAIDHEHSNKALLDTYTQTETDLADAVAKKHDHENAGVLTGITAEKVAAWDAKVDAVTAAADSGLKATRTDNSIAIEIDDSLVFVLDCGGSSVTA